MSPATECSSNDVRQKRTVALLVESSRIYGRGLLKGIAQYIHGTYGWRVLHQERGLDDFLPDWFVAGKFDGILARIEHPSAAELIAKLGRPAVDLRGLLPLPGVPFVATDDRATVDLALEHLRARGFRHLAFCGFGETDFSESRANFFLEYIGRLGLDVHIHRSPPAPGRLSTTASEARALVSDSKLPQWILSLPKPIGLLACNDARGRQVLDACRSCGVHVPDEVAVIGIDNDDVFCELSDPALSSVIPDCQRIGYEAAAMLDRMMSGSPGFVGSLTIEPLGVVTRQSTDMLAIDDPQIVAALRYIRDYAAAGITVDNVLDHLARTGRAAVSRSTLDKRFAWHLGRSIKQEILRVRIMRIKSLLQDTHYSLAKIAEMVALPHPEQLSTLFKRETAETPGEFRKRHHVPDSVGTDRGGKI